MIMIRLCLIDGRFSLLDGNSDLDTLMSEEYDDVVLSCDEFQPGIGRLEKGAADYVSRLLPYGYRAIWDESEVSCRNQNVNRKTTNPRISELRFRVILKREHKV